MFCAKAKPCTQSDSETESDSKQKDRNDDVQKRSKLSWSRDSFDKRQEGESTHTDHRAARAAGPLGQCNPDFSKEI